MPEDDATARSLPSSRTTEPVAAAAVAGIEEAMQCLQSCNITDSNCSGKSACWLTAPGKSKSFLISIATELQNANLEMHLKIFFR